MRMGPRMPSRCGWVQVVGLLVLALAPLRAVADDVPDPVRAAYEASTRLVREGKRGQLEQALALLDARKDEALDSVDYWELYARTWLMLDKDASALWDGVVAERQARAPASTVFDLVRYALAREPEAKRSWLEKALARNAKDLRARVAMGRFLLAEGDEDNGADLLEKVLEDHPGTVAALYALAELSLQEGFAKEALAYLDEALEHTKTADLYHLASLCHERMSKTYDHEACMAKALEAAGRALGLAPTDPHVEHFNQLLEATGDAVAATRALREHFERTKHPLLGSMLADAAFLAGDYQAALLGLEAGSASDLAVAKARATSYMRLGRAADAQRMAKQILAEDAQGRLFVARMHLWLGDAAAAKETLGSLADDGSRQLRALAHAWAGDVEALAQLAGKEARTGSRAGEDLLVAWFQARLLDRMGPEFATALKGKLLEARFKAGHDVLVQDGDASADVGTVKTEGWPRRALTYFRSPCGVPYRYDDGGEGRSVEFDGEGQEMTIYRSVSGHAACGEARHGFEIRFNGIKAKMSGNGLFEAFSMDGDAAKLVEFGPAEEAFGAASGAWLAGQDAAADAACLKALAIEPSFSRLKVYRAVARALSPDGEKRADAKDAAAAAALYTDDFELRRMVIFLRAWAGDAGLTEEIDALAKREAKMNIRKIANL